MYIAASNPAEGASYLDLAEQRRRTNEAKLAAYHRMNTSNQEGAAKVGRTIRDAMGMYESYQAGIAGQAASDAELLADTEQRVKRVDSKIALLNDKINTNEAILGTKGVDLSAEDRTRLEYEIKSMERQKSELVSGAQSLMNNAKVQKAQLKLAEGQGPLDASVSDKAFDKRQASMKYSDEEFIAANPVIEDWLAGEAFPEGYLPDAPDVAVNTEGPLSQVTGRNLETSRADANFTDDIGLGRLDRLREEARKNPEEYFRRATPDSANAASYGKPTDAYTDDEKNKFMWILKQFGLDKDKQ